MTDPPPAHLAPTSPTDDLDANNGVDSFPRLVETPATMSPVPTHELHAHAHAHAHAHSAATAPPPPTLDAAHATATTNDEAEAGDEEDSSWSTDSEREDDFASFRDFAAGDVGGSGPTDSRSIYQALFGGGGGPPQRSLGAQAARKLPRLPVYKLALGAADVDSCVKLEEACFPVNGASRDEITYRIAKASGLNIGLFTTAYVQSDEFKLATYETSHSSEADSNRRTVLVAYINATLTTNDRIKPEDVALPTDWQAAASNADSSIGHKPFGRTVVVHSFGVLPELRQQNIGTCLWKTFLQLVKGSKHYTRVAVAVPTELVPWFKKHKLRTLGSSALNTGLEQVKVDMVIDYHEDDDSDDEEDEDDEEETEDAQLDCLQELDDDDENDGLEAAGEQLIHES